MQGLRNRHGSLVPTLLQFCLQVNTTDVTACEVQAIVQDIAAKILNAAVIPVGLADHDITAVHEMATAFQVCLLVTSAASYT